MFIKVEFQGPWPISAQPIDINFVQSFRWLYFRYLLLIQVGSDHSPIFIISLG